MPMGEKNHNSKINKQIAIEVKTMLNNGISPTTISKELDVSKSIVESIKYGKTWNHVEV